ncbi:MAG: hypothetical protein EPN97_14630 [Alphaproteobacteria bacterium]|nr:MAG: hypothetical protein EPN97_14630 [Alphaproteobacteria bacterium]
MSLIPEGRELLKFAEDHGIEINFNDNIRGRAGEADAHSVTLNGEYSDTRLTITLIHELRHTQQFEFFKRSHVDHLLTFQAPRDDAFTFMDPRAQAFQMRLMEGDAFTFQAMSALKLKQMGRPEFYEEWTGSETKTIKAYITAHPPESFMDEQAMARGIFTHLQLHGLKRYDEHYFGMLRYTLNEHPKVEDALLYGAPRPNTEVPLTTLGAEKLGKLYGAELMSGTSLKALRTGIMQSYSPYDRETIKLAERLPGEAATLTQQEYAQKSSYIQARITFREESKAARDDTLIQKFGEAAHKYDGLKSTAGTEIAPKTSLLAKEPVMLEHPVAGSTAASSTFIKTPETAVEKPKIALKGGGIMAGVVMATASGIAAAATPDATPGKVADATINAVIPGYSAAKKGDLCAAFGEVVGVTASGAAMVATTAAAVPVAVAVTAASGPAAPVVGPLAAVGATATVAGAGAATYSAVAPGAEQLCKTAVSVKNFIGNLKI